MYEQFEKVFQEILQELGMQWFELTESDEVEQKMADKLGMTVIELHDIEEYWDWAFDTVQ